MSCSLDENLNPAKSITRELNENIDTVTFWNSASVYVIKKPEFAINDTLIIQAGTVIKFAPDSNCEIIVANHGCIFAQGTGSNPIVFTSYYDDSYGGASNKDNGAKKPSVGNWNEILFNNNSKSVLSNCRFYYGGSGNRHSTLQFGSTASANIMNCIFANNDGGNLETGYGVIDASDAEATMSIRFSTFYSNNLPLCINASINTDNSNIFHNPNSYPVKNKYNAIKVITSMHLSGAVQWEETEVAYVINGPTFSISPNASLLIGDSVTLKFMRNTKMILEGTDTTLRNIDGPGVALTSIFDDSYKGDTNGDGNSTQPEKEIGVYLLQILRPLHGKIFFTQINPEYYNTIYGKHEKYYLLIRLFQSLIAFLHI